MKVKTLVSYVWKVPLCGLIFFFGFIPGNWLASWLGMAAPELPAGANQTTIVQLTVLGALIMAIGLAAISRGISGNFLTRWLTLFFFTWVIYGVNNYIEASIFTSMGETALYSVVMYFPAALFCSVAVAWLFSSDVQGEGFLSDIRIFFKYQTIVGWVLRLLLAFLAFPLFYTIFGMIISPVVLEYYRQGTNELTLPGWDKILPVLALRSLLFLATCLPIIFAWRLSNLRLFLSLGLSLFILVGGLGMLTAYWLPPILRITHGLEICADEMFYSGALVLLLKYKTRQNANRQVSIQLN